MACVFGAGSTVGAGEESTHGTPVARSIWWAIDSISGDSQAQVADSMRLYDSLTATQSYSDTETTTLQMSGEMHYEGLGTLLKHVFGGVSTSGTSSPYSHAYTPGTLPAGLTLERLNGAATNSYVYEGCAIESWELTGSAGSPLTWSISVSAETRATPGAAGAPSEPTYSPVLPSHLNSSYIAWNSGNYRPESITLRYSNNLATDIRGQGSKYRQKPCRAGRPTVELTVVMDYGDSDALANAQLAGTQADLTMTYELSASAQMTIKLANAKLTSVEKPVQNAGRITQTVTWRGYGDASEEAVTVTIVNTQSSATA